MRHLRCSTYFTSKRLLITTVMCFLFIVFTKKVLIHVYPLTHQHKFMNGIPFDEFRYPLDIDMPAVVKAHRAGKDVDIKMINPDLTIYKTDTSEKCQHDIFLLFLVKSAVNHFHRRKSIRSTWGNEDSLLTNFTIKTIFLVGEHTSIDPGLNKRLDEEIYNHRDILQMSFSDTYYNCIKKIVGGIHWTVHHCNQAKFVMFVDDDFFVAKYNLIQYLITLSEANQEKLFTGFSQAIWPDRKPMSKWFVRYEYYPYDKFPPFISGGAMIMSMHLLKDIQIALQFTKEFMFDDVFLGIVMFKLGITPQNNTKIFIRSRVDTDSREFNTMIASHFYDNDHIMQLAWQAHIKLWRKVKQHICLTWRESRFTCTWMFSHSLGKVSRSVPGKGFSLANRI